MIKNKHLIPKLVCLITCFQVGTSFSQVISNQGAFVSVGGTTVLSTNTIINNATGTFSNNGTLNVSTVNNAGTFQGNGIYNLSQNIYNAGTFNSGTSTFNYVGNGAQTISTLQYYNLNVLQTTVRNVTLSDTGKIGIKNSFTPDTIATTYIVTGTTLNFNGTSTQNVPLFNYNNLEVDNVSGANLTGTTSVENSLKVTNGFLGSYGNLTLLSTVNQTAEIDGSGNGDVLGLVKIQRYIPSGFGYRFVSAPFQEITVNEFSDEVDLASSFTSFYRYNENLTSSGWQNYTDTNGILNPMEGYSVNFGSSNSPKTIELTGVVNNGILNSTWFNHNYTYTKGYNLVGNPYPSTIDWNIASGWNRTNVDNALYFFNASAIDQFTGTYSTYINGISSDGIASNLIASMQGFFIRVTDGTYPVSASLQINNNARVNNTQTTFHRQSIRNTRPLIRLETKYTGDPRHADPTVIYIDDMASEIFDENLDALKINNTDLHTPSLFSFSSNEEKLSINALPSFTDSLYEIRLGLITNQPGSITFNAPTIENIPAGWHVYFSDAETGKYQDLSINKVYNIDLAEGNFENRFKLIFSLNPIADQSEISVFSIYTVQNKLHIILNQERSDDGEVIVTNMQGQNILKEKISGMGKHELAKSLNLGIYIVTYRWDKGVESKKFYIGGEQ